MVTKLSKNLQENNSETVTNEHDKGIPKGRYIPRRKIQNYWWSVINITV